MIRSFKGRETQRFYQTEKSTVFPPEIQARAYKLLYLLDTVESLQPLRAIGSVDLKKRKGKDKAYHSIRVNKQWRIKFKWVDGDAEDVELADTH